MVTRSGILPIEPAAEHHGSTEAELVGRLPCKRPQARTPAQVLHLFAMLHSRPLHLPALSLPSPFIRAVERAEDVNSGVIIRASPGVTARRSEPFPLGVPGRGPARGWTLGASCCCPSRPADSPLAPLRCGRGHGSFACAEFIRPILRGWRPGGSPERPPGLSGRGPASMVGRLRLMDAQPRQSASVITRTVVKVNSK